MVLRARGGGFGTLVTAVLRILKLSVCVCLCVNAECWLRSRLFERRRVDGYSILYVSHVPPMYTIEKLEQQQQQRQPVKLHVATCGDCDRAARQ